MIDCPCDYTERKGDNWIPTEPPHKVMLRPKFRDVHDLDLFMTGILYGSVGIFVPCMVIALLGFSEII